MKCGRADCTTKGAWIPTLVLVPPPTMKQAEARFEVSIVVCGQHKTENAQVYLSDAVWTKFVEYFKERGLAYPHRSLTRVEYKPTKQGLS